jgi:salicylate hydroxylase
MPPGGHSVGLALEDAVLVARLVERQAGQADANIHDVFPRFVELRAPRINKDFDEAEKRWDGVKTVSWWWQMLREYVYWIFVAFFAKHIDTSYGYDIFKQEL